MENAGVNPAVGGAVRQARERYENQLRLIKDHTPMDLGAEERRLGAHYLKASYRAMYRNAAEAACTLACVAGAIWVAFQVGGGPGASTTAFSAGALAGLAAHLVARVLRMSVFWHVLVVAALMPRGIVGADADAAVISFAVGAVIMSLLISAARVCTRFEDTWGLHRDLNKQASERAVTEVAATEATDEAYAQARTARRARPDLAAAMAGWMVRGGRRTREDCAMILHADELAHELDVAIGVSGEAAAR